jgi:hypothetical protein
MEEDPMATSLLFALLDVENEAELQAQVQNHPHSRAGRYGRLGDKQKTRVQEALYQAFYPILEARYINPSAYAASRGIGGALGRIISGQTPDEAFMESDDINQLKDALTTLVDRAIRNEEP